MTPMDERFLDIMNQIQSEEETLTRKAAAQKSIVTQIRAGTLRMGRQTIPFENKSLLEQKVAIFLPAELTLMSAETAAVKYPSRQRPELIFTNENTTINITFNHTKTPLDDSKMVPLKDTMLQTVKRMQSSLRILEEGIQEIGGQKAGIIEFLAPALDCRIYNLVCCTALEGRALLCSFNCMEELMESWQPVAWGIMQTLSVARK